MAQTVPQNSTTVRAPFEIRAARAGLRVLSPRAPGLAARYAERLFLTARRHARPDWEREILANATSFRIAHEGEPLPAWQWGEGRDVALLVHGWEGRGSQLGAFVDPLVAAGLRVVAFDAPGHGDAPRKAASLVEHARAVASVARSLEAKGARIHAVVGHSVGGAAALVATRFGLEADRFALVAPPVSPERFARQFARVLDVPPEIWTRTMARLEQRYGMRLEDLDVRKYASKVHAPLLVIHDDDDRIVPPADGASIATAAPHGRFVTTHGLGHQRVLRASEVVDAVTLFAAGGVPSHDEPSFAETLDGELFDRSRRW